MRKKLFVVLMSIIMIMTFIPTIAFANELPCSVNVRLDSVKLDQKISFDKEEALVSQIISSDAAINLVIGFYNGKEQKLNVKTSGVDVKYSDVSGEVWDTKAPAFKDADMNLSLIIDMITTVADAAEDEEATANASAEAMLMESGKLFKMRIDNGSASAESYILPVIIPKGIAVQFKSRNLGFAPDKKIDLNDILEIKTLAGCNEDIVDFVYNIKELVNKNPLDKEVTIGNFINYLMSKVTTTDVCSADKEFAKTFMNKYFSLRKIPNVGVGNKISLIDNVRIDLAGIIRDLESGTSYGQKLLGFMRNYDILSEIFFIQSQQDGIGYTFPSIIAKKLGASKISNREFTTGGFGKGKSGITISFYKIADGLYKTNANLSYSKAYNKISASNVTKVYHVKNANRLNNTKHFTFKAKPDYGYVTFKKMSGTKNVKIDKYTGRVTVKKGLKKNKTYKIKVKISAPGKAVYKNISIKVKK